MAVTYKSCSICWSTGIWHRPSCNSRQDIAPTSPRAFAVTIMCLLSPWRRCAGCLAARSMILWILSLMGRISEFRMIPTLLFETIDEAVVHREYQCPCGQGCIVERRIIGSAPKNVSVSINCIECQKHFHVINGKGRLGCELYHDYTSYYRE